MPTLPFFWFLSIRLADRVHMNFMGEKRRKRCHAVLDDEALHFGANWNKGYR